MLPLLLIAIVFILVVLLSIQQPAVSPHTDHDTTWRDAGRSPTSTEEERPLSDAERKGAFPGHDDRRHKARDHAFNARLTSRGDRWKPVDDRKTDRVDVERENVAKLQRDLSACVSQNADLQHQIGILSKDLEGARLFLTTADAFSDSEVIQLLEKLNAELQLVSAIVAERIIDGFQLEPKAVETLDPEHQTAVNRASESIGLSLVQSFQTARPDDFPMYLQTAFQAYLAHRLCWIVSSWTLDQSYNAFMNEIYERLRKTERQAISARWRALTHIYALPTCVSEPSSFVTPILAGLSDVLLAAGYSSARSDAMSELSPMFETRVLSIVSLAGRLNEMIGGVISGDFEAFVVRPGEKFNEGTMVEDMDGSGDGMQGAPSGTGKAKIVLCTSELGLKKRVCTGTGEVGAVAVTKTVIRAKVILESFLVVED